MRSFAVALLLLPCAACITPADVLVVPRGLLYSHTTEPYTGNLHDTPSSIVIHEEGSTRQLAEPIVAGIAVKWDTTAFADIAKACGMKELHYADVESLVILRFFFGGIYRHDTIHLYGR
jgi:hypothetical protein